MAVTKHDRVRILHVIGSLAQGGVETWLMHVLRHIDRDIFQMDFCCLSGDEGVYATEARSLGSHIHVIQLSKNLLAFNKQFTCLLREQEYRIVHSHVHHFSGYILRLACNSGVPIRLAHSHNDTLSLDRRASLLRKSYLWVTEYLIKKYATNGLACSRKAADALYGSDWERDNRWQLLYCGIDPKPFASLVDRTQIRKELGIPPDASVVGHVGRFHEQKNHSFLIDIMHEAVKQNPDVWLLLIGDGPLRLEIEKKVTALGLGKQVVFAGLRPDVPRLMKAMDVFVMPSIHEGLPVTGIEAQAAGLRFLCSDLVTNEVAIVSDAVQFLPLDLPAVDWARRILAMLEAPRVDTRMAWETVAASSFAIENSTSALTQFYQMGLA